MLQKIQSVSNGSHCFCTCVKAEHYGQECAEKQNCSPQVSLEAKRKGKQARDLVSPSRTHLQCPSLLHSQNRQNLCFKGSATQHSAIGEGPSTTHESLGAVTDHSIQCKERPRGPGSMGGWKTSNPCPNSNLIRYSMLIGCQLIIRIGQIIS